MKTRHNNLRLFPILILLVLIGISFMNCDSKNMAKRDALKMGVSVPSEEMKAFDIRFEDLHGEVHNLKDFEGKVIILNLWASWCVPCKLEMPSFEELHNKFGENDNFTLLAINIEKDDTIPVIKDYVEDKGFTFFIGNDAYLEAYMNFFIGSIPTTYIIDKDFKIVGRVVGTTDWSSPVAYRFINNLIQSENSIEIIED